jgi:hypothetical protein
MGEAALVQSANRNDGPSPGGSGRGGKRRRNARGYNRVEFQAETLIVGIVFRVGRRNLHELHSPNFASSYLSVDAVGGHFYLGDSAKGE